MTVCTQRRWFALATAPAGFCVPALGAASQRFDGHGAVALEAGRLVRPACRPGCSCAALAIASKLASVPALTPD
jgi:hypothetical protein